MKKIYLISAFILVMECIGSAFLFAQIAVNEAISPAADASKISLDLKGMDIVEVLKMLAAKGNLNVVVGANVRGKVTMFLKDVDINDAFDLILVANNLAKDERNGIVYVMTERDYELLYGTKYDDKKEAKVIPLKYAKASEVGKVLNQVKSKVGQVIIDESSNTIVAIDSPDIISQIVMLVNSIDKPTKRVVIELRYAKAKDMKDKVQELLTKGLGTMQIDERTNKIVVTDLESNIDKVIDAINAFDSKLQQVLIESKIIEITLSDEFKLGVDWDAVINEFQKQLNKDIGIKMDFKLASQGALIPGGEVLIGAFGSGDYAAMVQALKKVGDTNILSSPRITAMNNEEAKILVGSNQPYATNTVTQGTSTTTTATSLTFLDIGVKLYVTPTINKDGFVSIKIKPEVSSKADNYTYGDPETTVPVISTTQAETNVMVKDGHTIIIAGLIKDERASTVYKVPFLGDIPFIGQAFSKTQDTVTKKELVIFLTPHIISGEVDYVKQPETYPIGEKTFTEPEWPTFYKREGVRMDPSYIWQKGLGKKERKLDIKTSSPEDYFYTIRKTILDNISIPADEKIYKGDKVSLSFLLSSSGNLITEPEVLESTNEDFKNLAKTAVEKASPFPIFPDSIKDDKKRFTIELIYE